MNKTVIIVGGGAAGFFAAITCAEADRGISVILLEKGPAFLSKVRISGGGRCNVTHACFDPQQLTTYYPRGGPALHGPFCRFQPSDTIEWFESRGVKLKIERDGRIFPVSDSSRTIIECLLNAAKAAGVQLQTNCPVEIVVPNNNGSRFRLQLAAGKTLECNTLMLATGGCRAVVAGKLAVGLGHSLEPPVPSLFTFHVADPWIRALAGVTVETVELSLPQLRRREGGALLLTHSGLSGPAILRLSAWEARELHRLNYQFKLRVNWLPALDNEGLIRHLEARRSSQPARLIVNTPIAPLAARLWESLVLTSGIPRETRWADLSKSARGRLTEQLTRTELQVSGKTLNQDEFVTCGGVRLNEVNFKTMESRICRGLYFGGELLDIDGLTGGFNFQSAWTSGWIAGKAMAQ